VQQYLSDIGVSQQVGKRHSEFRIPKKRYLGGFGVSQQVGKDDFVPEPAFYMLAMKADNDTARVFQKTVAYDILPSIRKHGAYLTPAKIEEVLLNPNTTLFC